MTEQEKREKEIYELTEYLVREKGYIYRIAKTVSIDVIDAGYLKEEEVRKEIFDKLIEVSKNFDGVLPVGVLKAWAIEFGVEV